MLISTATNDGDTSSLLHNSADVKKLMLLQRWIRATQKRRELESRRASSRQKFLEAEALALGPLSDESDDDDDDPTPQSARELAITAEPVEAVSPVVDTESDALPHLFGPQRVPETELVAGVTHVPAIEPAFLIETASVPHPSPESSQGTEAPRVPDVERAAEAELVAGVPQVEPVILIDVASEAPQAHEAPPTPEAEPISEIRRVHEVEVTDEREPLSEVAPVVTVESSFEVEPVPVIERSARTEPVSAAQSVPEVPRVLKVERAVEAGLVGVVKPVPVAGPVSLVEAASESPRVGEVEPAPEVHRTSEVERAAEAEVLSEAEMLQRQLLAYDESTAAAALCDLFDRGASAITAPFEAESLVQVFLEEAITLHHLEEDRPESADFASLTSAHLRALPSEGLDRFELQARHIVRLEQQMTWHTMQLEEMIAAEALVSGMTAAVEGPAMTAAEDTAVAGTLPEVETGLVVESLSEVERLHRQRLAAEQRHTVAALRDLFDRGACHCIAAHETESRAQLELDEARQLGGIRVRKADAWSDHEVAHRRRELQRRLIEIDGAATGTAPVPSARHLFVSARELNDREVAAREKIYEASSSVWTALRDERADDRRRPNPFPMTTTQVSPAGRSEAASLDTSFKGVHRSLVLHSELSFDGSEAVGSPTAATASFRSSRPASGAAPVRRADSVTHGADGAALPHDAKSPPVPSLATPFSSSAGNPHSHGGGDDVAAEVPGCGALRLDSFLLKPGGYTLRAAAPRADDGDNDSVSVLLAFAPIGGGVNFDAASPVHSDWPNSDVAAALESIKAVFVQQYGLREGQSYRLRRVDLIDSVLVVGVTAFMDDFTSPSMSPRVGGRRRSDPSADRRRISVKHGFLTSLPCQQLWRNPLLLEAMEAELAGKLSDGSGRPLAVGASAAAAWVRLEDCCAALLAGLVCVMQDYMRSNRAAAPAPANDKHNLYGDDHDAGGDGCDALEVSNFPFCGWAEQFVTYGLQRLVTDRALPKRDVAASVFDLLASAPSYEVPSAPRSTEPVLFADRRLPFRLFDSAFLSQMESKSRLDALCLQTNIDYAGHVMERGGVPYLAFSTFLYHESRGWRYFSLLRLRRSIDPLLQPTHVAALVADRNMRRSPLVLPTPDLPMTFVLRGVDRIAAVADTYVRFAKVQQDCRVSVAEAIRLGRESPDASRDGMARAMEDEPAVSRRGLIDSARSYFYAFLNHAPEDHVHNLTAKSLMLLVVFAVWAELDEEASFSAGETEDPQRRQSSRWAGTARGQTRSSSTPDRFWSRRIYRAARNYFIACGSGTESDSSPKATLSVTAASAKIVTLFYDFVLNIRGHRRTNCTQFIRNRRLPTEEGIARLSTEMHFFRNEGESHPPGTDPAHFPGAVVRGSDLSTGPRTALDATVNFTKYPDGPRSLGNATDLLMRCLDVAWMNYSPGMDGIVDFFSLHHREDDWAINVGGFRRTAGDTDEMARIVQEGSLHATNLNALMDVSMSYLEALWSGSRWMRTVVSTTRHPPNGPVPLPHPRNAEECMRRLAEHLVDTWPYAHHQRVPFCRIPHTDSFEVGRWQRQRLDDAVDDRPGESATDPLAGTARPDRPACLDSFASFVSTVQSFIDSDGSPLAPPRGGTRPAPALFKSIIMPDFDCAETHADREVSPVTVPPRRTIRAVEEERALRAEANRRSGSTVAVVARTMPQRAVSRSGKRHNLDLVQIRLHMPDPHAGPPRRRQHSDDCATIVRRTERTTSPRTLCQAPLLKVRESIEMQSVSVVVRPASLRPIPVPRPPGFAGLNPAGQGASLASQQVPAAFQMPLPGLHDAPAAVVVPLLMKPARTSRHHRVARIPDTESTASTPPRRAVAPAQTKHSKPANGAP